MLHHYARRASIHSAYTSCRMRFGEIHLLSRRKRAALRAWLFPLAALLPGGNAHPALFH